MARRLSHHWMTTAALALSACAAPAQAQSREQFFNQLDMQMSQGVPADEPGAVIIVARDGE
ncbi:MAG: hypothetical protein VYC34_00280, partial [Planctomycetota bacterium]|nr:hypothetical protein [Planctomycetota bacterium]